MIDTTELLLEIKRYLIDIERRLGAVEAKLDGINLPPGEFLTKRQVADLLHVSLNSIYAYQKQHWVEGVHYFPQERLILYNGELIADWAKNRHQPIQHELAIIQWVRKQPYNQKGGRKPKQLKT